MARLHASRTAPITRISKRRKRSYRNGRLIGRYHHSTGIIGQVRKMKGSSLPESIELIKETLAPSKLRWIALTLFCALSCAQCCIWSTWSPISNAAMHAFPTWNKSLLALLSNWGCIMYLICCLPSCWFINKKGLFVPIQIAASLSTLAAFVRCLSTQETIFTTFAHLGAILNSLSGVLISPTTALLSAMWFPRGERTTATGISSACSQLGMAISYVIGPAIVSTVPFEPVTHTTQIIDIRNLNEEYPFYLAKIDSESIVTTIPMFEDANEQSTCVQIISLLRIEFVALFLLLLAVVCLFPKDPHTVLELSPISPHLGLIGSLISLFNVYILHPRNRNMWKLCLAAALSQGTTGPWLALITLTFGSLITQAEADNLAFWTVVVSSILCLTASRLTDIFQGHLKVTIHVLLTTSVAMFLWVLLLDSRVLIFHKRELYVAVILGISASWSTPALFLELASEIAFPVSEAIVGGYMIFLSNLIGTLFYFSYFACGFAEYWSTFCLFGNIVIASILVLLVKQEYNRTKMESDIEFQLYRSVEKMENNR